MWEVEVSVVADPHEVFLTLTISTISHLLGK